MPVAALWQRSCVASLSPGCIKVHKLCGTVLALTFLLTMMKATSIQNPLHKMRYASEQIKQKNYDAQLPVVSTDELGQLGESMHEFADQAVKAALQMRAAQETLNQEWSAAAEAPEFIRLVCWQSIRFDC